jgi:hypothetical protein
MKAGGSGVKFLFSYTQGVQGEIGLHRTLSQKKNKNKTKQKKTDEQMKRDWLGALRISYLAGRKFSSLCQRSKVA